MQKHTLETSIFPGGGGGSGEVKLNLAESRKTLEHVAETRKRILAVFAYMHRLPVSEKDMFSTYVSSWENGQQKFGRFLDFCTAGTSKRILKSLYLQYTVSGQVCTHLLQKVHVVLILH